MRWPSASWPSITTSVVTRLCYEVRSTGKLFRDAARTAEQNDQMTISRVSATATESRGQGCLHSISASHMVRDAVVALLRREMCAGRGRRDAVIGLILAQARKLPKRRAPLPLREHLHHGPF